MPVGKDVRGGSLKFLFFFCLHFLKIQSFQVYDARGLIVTGTCCGPIPRSSHYTPIPAWICLVILKVNRSVSLPSREIKLAWDTWPVKEAAKKQIAIQLTTDNWVQEYNAGRQMVCFNGADEERN